MSNSGPDEGSDESPEAVVELTPCCLGLDLGNHSSKVTLAFVNDHGVKEIARVGFHGSFNDPNRPPRNTETLFEFVAAVGVHEGRAVEGRRALDLDINFALKEAAIWRATGDRGLVEGLPRGPELLYAVDANIAPGEEIDRCLTEHLDFLYNQADAYTRIHHLEVVTINITYPNYLGRTEVGTNKSRQFDKYMNYVEGKVKGRWGDLIRYETSSEGQMVAAYICQTFRDPVVGRNRTLMTQRLFPNLKDRNQGVLVVIDNGSSSMNIQIVSICFNGDGEMESSESILVDGQQLGVQGGSDSVNTAVKKCLMEKLDDRIKAGTVTLRPGDLAAYLRDFERRKVEINYADDDDEDLEIVLHTGKRNRTLQVTLEASKTRKCFQTALAPGIAAFDSVCQFLLDFHSDFAILGCGGTCSDLGFRSVIKERVAQHRVAAEERGISIGLEFMGEFETQFWSSTVSGGAALSVLGLPDPVGLMKKSAIGLQLLIHQDGRWQGETAADIMFGPRCFQSWPSDQAVSTSPDVARTLKFALVCDPEYANSGALFQPIKVNPPEEVLTGDVATYDMGWDITGDHLPAGVVRFRIDSSLLSRIASGRETLADLDQKDIPVVISCSRIDYRQKQVPDSRDQKWILSLRTDPATRHLTVRSARKVSFWCSRCNCELHGTIRVCDECQDFNVCWACFPRIRHPEHEISSVQIPN